MTGTLSAWAADVLLSLAPNQQAETRGDRFLQLADEARAQVREVPLHEIRLLLRQGVKVVDVREGEEYGRGHLPGALHISRGVIELRIERLLPDLATTLILYCGAGNRSTLAAESLQKMGYTGILVLRGGIKEWLKAGLPVRVGSRLLDD